ncbi:hypothetical protein ZOSMA_15G01600 [Zostera marina]|uniref:DUF1664 domain-containing protein n=1 Tax=Zostera marina TaxID=29655 RepID=A0A0K9PV00_ZOSMR|nr:hypothetical protein ZOSMA_15G01600 [Zostera marina]
MALQMGLSKALILIGAGYAGSVVVRNGKLSDILGELQLLLKNMEKSGESSGSDTETNAVVSQLERLAREVQLMASSRPITVVNGGSSQGGNLSSLIVPAATLSVVGYGYMWWKGYKFSDLMYVTKKNMATAVSNMTQHLGQLSDALAATKRHLTQRIQNVDGKLDEQKDISKDIRNEVSNARGDISKLGVELDSLHQLFWGLNNKMDTIEEKQNFAAAGVMYLCQFVSEKGGKVPEFLQNATKTTGKRFLGFTETTSLKGLQHITNAIESGDYDNLETNPTS